MKQQESDAAPDHRHFVALGSIASQAPEAALLAALGQLRPQLQVRLCGVPASGGSPPRFRVDVLVDDNSETDGSGAIDLWLCLKSALIAAFPEGKPNAVTAVDP